MRERVYYDFDYFRITEFLEETVPNGTDQLITMSTCDIILYKS